MVEDKSLVAVALGLAGPVGVLWVGSQVASAQTGQRPNVLIFVTDDQRHENTMWVMPKTRRYFERGGVNYTKARGDAPLLPVRTTILTGRTHTTPASTGMGRQGREPPT